MIISGRLRNNRKMVSSDRRLNGTAADQRWRDHVLAPIDPKAKPAVAGRACEAAEAVAVLKKLTPTGSKCRVPAALVTWAPEIPSAARFGMLYAEQM